MNVMQENGPGLVMSEEAEMLLELVTALKQQDSEATIQTKRE